MYQGTINIKACYRVFPWNYILGDTSPHLHLFKGTFQAILGDNHMTLDSKIANFRGHLCLS